MEKIDFEKFLCSFIEAMKEFHPITAFNIPVCIKKALNAQGLQYKDGKIEENIIKSGTHHKCIEDVVMEDDGEIRYIKDKIYESEIDKCITDEFGEKEHYWVDGEYYKYFQQIEPDETQKTPHKWRDGDIVRLKEDNGKRWTISKLEDEFGFFGDKWFFSEMGVEYVAGGILYTRELDKNYEFVANPTNDTKEVLKKCNVEIDKMIPSYLEGYADGRKTSNSELLCDFTQSEVDNMVHHFKNTKENFLNKRISDIYRKGITDTLEKLRKKTI